MEDYILRKATKDDMQLLYHWANESGVRKNSFQNAPIDWEQHKIWFNKKLEDRDCDIYIYCIDKKPIGQIRLEYNGNCADIHYSIDISYRGKGYGQKILLLAENKIQEERNEILYFHAEVKKDNIASKKKFEQLGYERTEFIKYSKQVGLKKYDTTFNGEYKL